MKVAIVHEWFVTHAGSEKVVEQMLRIYPDADLFSLVEFLPAHQRDFIQQKPVTTSFIQTLPLAKRHFRQYLPLMPLAVEQFDLAGYDLIISSNHAVAKGVLTRPDQLHISYVHTPIRYAWEFQAQYLQQAGLTRGLKGMLARLTLHYLRLWDVASANRVDTFVTNSRYVARRVQATYRRSAQVIYPPVAVQRFCPHQPRESFYLAIARFVPYKRVDLIVAAFAQLGYPLVVIGDGSERDRIQSLATANITFLGYQPDAVVANYLQRCRAFIFAAEEDFGITAVEAQAAGAPVIAYGKGGVAETVLSGQTGLFFAEQTVESLIHAVKEFETGCHEWNPMHSRQNAERFSELNFRQQFAAFVDQAWLTFERGDAVE
jgi:glycosyltransferase involved in cell wall biosynthesis